VAILDGSESNELPKPSVVILPVDNSDSLLNIDLNANMNENDDKKTSAVANLTPADPEPANPSLSEPPPTDIKHHEEIPGWSLSDVDKMAIDSMQLAQLGTRMDEDDEDYDEEG
jgi:hypothetical protein